MTRKYKLALYILLLLGFTVVWNEYILFVLVLLRCQWPMLDDSHDTLKVMLLADTHLLGRHGHWFDAMRR